MRYVETTLNSMLLEVLVYVVCRYRKSPVHQGHLLEIETSKRGRFLGLTRIRGYIWSGGFTMPSIICSDDGAINIDYSSESNSYISS
jgi:hypothetical protein